MADRRKLNSAIHKLTTPSDNYKKPVATRRIQQYEAFEKIKPLKYGQGDLWKIDTRDRKFEGKVIPHWELIAKDVREILKDKRTKILDFFPQSEKQKTPATSQQ